MIGVILFDVDGVLVDAGPWHYEALNDALTSYRCPPIGLEEHREFFDGLPTKIKLARLVERGSVDERDEEAIKRLKQQLTLSKIRSNCVLDPEKFSVLAGLKAAGYRIGVVSNAVYETVALVLKLSGLGRFVDIVTSNEDGPSKPNPALYELAARRFSVQPEECLAVEDGAYGVEAATKAGCKVLQIRNSSELTASLVWETIKKENNRCLPSLSPVPVMDADSARPDTTSQSL